MNCGYFYVPYVPIEEEEEMIDTTILKQRHPELAEFIEGWRSKYSRKFDLSKDEEKANFYEGMVEMAKHIAATADSVSLDMIFNIDGVSHVGVEALPCSDSNPENND